MNNIFDRKSRDYTFLVSFFFFFSVGTSNMGKYLLEHFLVDLT